MTRSTIRVVLNTPNKDLFSFLQKNLNYHNIELFSIPPVTDLEDIVEKILPHVIIIYISKDQVKYRLILKTIEKIYNRRPCWFFLMVEDNMPIQDIHSILPRERFFLFPSNADYHYIAHNLATVKELEQSFVLLNDKSKFEENVNYSFKIINQEGLLPNMFSRLVNYLPKILPIEYMAVFNVDEKMEQVVNFTQFVPPGKSQIPAMTRNLEKMAESWVMKGNAFNLNERDDPQLFKKLIYWGWPVAQLYFIPVKIRENTLGGLVLGNAKVRELESKVLLFLNDAAKLIAQRIFYSYLSGLSRSDHDDFANQLIHNRFSEDSIYYLSCKKINQTAHGVCTVFWQYNKGFGFIFPKYFYFEDGKRNLKSLEKNVIFLNKEKYFSQLITQGKIEALDNIFSNPDLGESTKKTFDNLKYNNLLIIPLRINDEVTGAFIVNKAKDNEKYGIWEIHDAEEVVRQIEKVIEDTQIVKEAQLKLKQLSRIFELGNDIKLDLNLDEILSVISQSLRKTLGWNDISILLLDETGKILKVNNVVGYDQKIQLDIDVKKDINLKKFEGILASCKKIGSSYFYDSQKLNAGRNESANSQNIIEWQEKDLLCVPIETRNKVLGHMIFHDPIDRLKPTLEKVVPLEFYANQAAIAVENAILFEQLQDSEERYRSLAETMSLGLATCDLNGNIIYINPAFKNLADLNEKTLLSKKLESLFLQKSKLDKIVNKLLDEKSDAQTNVLNVELELSSKSGEKIPVSVYAFPFFQRREKVGFFIVINDLRAIKRLERIKADFNSMVVHDLRSPMNVIQGFIELIRNRIVGNINTEQEELLDIAKENVKKVLTLVDNFLVASKIEVGKFNLDPKVNEINALIERVVENHKVLVSNKNVDLKINLDKNLPLLFFDSLRIEQVLNNLLSNAMKFTPENGEICIGSNLLRKDNKGEEKFYSCISVQDTGPGIPKEKVKDIFEKYKQVEPGHKLSSIGTGLGLSICQEIINLHRGEIWVESEMNKGSKFSFILPIEPTLEKIIS